MTGQQMKDNFFLPDFDLSDQAMYEHQCDVLNDSAMRRNRCYWSKMYGINRKSVLCELTQFPVTQNIVQDPMHCSLEGVCGQEITLFLNRVIYELGLVSLNWLNDRLQNFKYFGRDGVNRPNNIEKVRHYDAKHVPQTESKCHFNIVLHFTNNNR